jgi:hypothetical protein
MSLAVLQGNRMYGTTRGKLEPDSAQEKRDRDLLGLLIFGREYTDIHHTNQLLRHDGQTTCHQKATLFEQFMES